MYIDNQTIVQIFYKMLKARLFEEKAVYLKEKGIIEGGLHLSIGQEATAAAVCALESEDVIFAPHRNFTIAIAADVNTGALFAELAGLKEGLSGGQAGSGSFSDNTVNFYGSTALAGGNFAKAVGAALSFKLQRKSNCVACFAGDGAAADGSFFEAMNMACLYKLPIIFFIENNCYTERSSVDKIHSVTDIAERAKGYNVPGLIVDGNNAVEVYGAMIKAMDYAKTSQSPILVESKTYRLAGYTLEDDQEYRTNSEIKQWAEYDAIDNITSYMIDNGIGIMDDLMMIRKKIEDEINTDADTVMNLADFPNVKIYNRQEAELTASQNEAEDIEEKKPAAEKAASRFVFTGFENE